MMVAVLLTATIGVSAQDQPKTKLRPSSIVYLYPEGQASGKGLAEAGGPFESNGHTGTEDKFRNEGALKEVGDNARIELYFPKKPNGQMVVVCPGGGYQILSIHNEGVYAAEWLLAKGITVAVLKYRMPNGHWGIPVTDVQNTFRYCRAHAAEWKVKQIGIMGFSAGGHLAASASNLFVDKVTRPDFTILYYPVITMNRKLTHMGTRTSLIGEDKIWMDRNKLVDEYEKTRKLHHDLIDIFSLEKQVTKRTPKTFIVVGEDDKLVPVENSLMYYNALVKNHVPAEIHVFPNGAHGFGFNAEKYIGKGNDFFANNRAILEQCLAHWLESIKE